MTITNGRTDLSMSWGEIHAQRACAVRVPMPTPMPLNPSPTLCGNLHNRAIDSFLPKSSPLVACYLKEVLVILRFNQENHILMPSQKRDFALTVSWVAKCAPNWVAQRGFLFRIVFPISQGRCNVLASCVAKSTTKVAAQ